MKVLLRYLLLVWVGVAAPAVAVDGEQEATEIARWRAQRLASLTGDTGWLTVVGLYWLKDGVNSFGRDRSNTIAIDHAALDGRAGRFEPEPRGCVREEGRPAAAGALASDASGAPTLLSCGSLQFWIIERGGRLGLRVRDLDSAARRDFHGLDYFPVDASWALETRFEPYRPAHRVAIVNVLGMELDMLSPGAVIFERDGHEWRLDALLEEPDSDSLFLMFADGTSGHETYGAGRFLYTSLPAGERVAVDFNKAYSPPCAFTRFATCPLPPPQNRLELRVTAGELAYRDNGH